jgi:cytochrome c biogenesis protein CcmG/thiol:disulfide interchange protein DsbE
MNRYLVPLGIFVLLVVLLGVGLTLNPREVPSPLINKPAPEFTLPRLEAQGQTIGTTDMRGKVWLLNVWASWCVSCRAEHPLVMDLARTGAVEIVGLNYKDENDAAREWLQRHGNPYTVSAVDADGRVGIDWGVYGVPETFVVDRSGTIRYKQIGPLTREVIEKKVLPLVRQLEKEPA